ncbi:MAG: Fic family protein [Bacteroidia bacterium]
MFASKIKKLRKEKGLKINEVASFLAIDSSLVSRFEAGTRRPTDHQVVKLEDFYKTKPNELLREWVADDIINNLKKYSFAGDVMQIVEDAISGYQKLLNKQKKQVLPKNLVKVLHDIDLLKKQIDALKPLNVLQLKKLNDYFFTQYTYDSNKIEGNTLSLQETSMVIKEGLTIGGKSLKEHLEVIGHNDAVSFINEIAMKEETLSERTIKDLHYLILKNIETQNAGTYRNVEVRISGSKHEPPAFFDVPPKMQSLINYFQLHSKNLHPVVLAADMHQILVGIHPFIDGNGRTSRLLMNLILLQNGYYIANIKGSLQSRLSYYKSLEAAHVNGNLSPFRLLVAKAVKESLSEFYKLIK